MSGHIFWFMGLSGAGKTTLSQRLLQHIQTKELPVEIIDGDVLRDFFDGDYGYTRNDRIAVTKRIAFAAHVLSKQNIQVIVANISPYHEIQNFLRLKLGDTYHQIYLKTSLEKVKERDVKGLYRRFEAGQEQHVVGIDEPFEEPIDPELVIDTEMLSVEESWKEIESYYSQS